LKEEDAHGIANRHGYETRDQEQLYKPPRQHGDQLTIAGANDLAYTRLFTARLHRIDHQSEETEGSDAQGDKGDIA